MRMNRSLTSRYAGMNLPLIVMDAGKKNKRLFTPRMPFFKVFPPLWIGVMILLATIDIGSKVWITKTLNFHLAPHQVEGMDFSPTMVSLYNGKDSIPVLGDNGEIFKLRLVFNDRFVFGSGPSAPILGMYMTLAAIIFLFFFRWHNPDSGHSVAWLLVFSGAIGNLADKMFVKSLMGRNWEFSLVPVKYHVSGVVDFLEVIWFGWDAMDGVPLLGFLAWKSWPTFNIADSFIVVGITLLLFLSHNRADAKSVA